MKVRWRQHEILLGSLIAIALLAGLVIDSSRAGAEHLLPQAGFVIAIYACFLWINLFIVPFIRKGIENRNNSNITVRIALAVLQFGLIAFIIALAANIVTYFAHPYLYNYAGFGLIALFGYNDQPLVNLFAGFDRALGLVSVYAVYLFLRETAIHHIEKQEGSRGYRVLVANQVTIAIVIFICIPVFLRSLEIVPMGSDFLDAYLYLLPPVLLMFLVNTYYLFPRKGKKAFIDIKNILLWLFFAFICTAPFIAMMPHKPSGFFPAFIAAQLFLVTPISWLIYQQRKDRILELRGMEKSLLRSEADLQFLRNQINPHFLFNSLNTLYSTALQEDSYNTAEGIQKLGDMMRFMLHENHLDRIPVSRELEYLENYISFQKLRIQSSPDIIIEEKLNGNCRHTIAPMLLIPLVENAFKHGISLTSKSWIKIKLDCDDKTLNFEVRNSIHSLKPGDPEYEKSGVGLKNVKDRLSLLYNGRHQFVYSQENNEFVARLNVRVN